MEKDPRTQAEQDAKDTAEREAAEREGEKASNPQKFQDNRGGNTGNDAYRK